MRQEEGKKATQMYSVTNLHKLYYNAVNLAMRSKAWVCGRPLAGIAASIPAPGHGYLSLVIVVCCLRRADPSLRGVLPRTVVWVCLNECDQVQH